MNLRREIAQIAESKRPVVVAGMGRSGIAATRFFQRLGIEVWCIEKKAAEEFQSSSIQDLINSGAVVYFGDMLPAHVRDAALGVISPGISLQGNVPQALSRVGVPLVGELELGVEYLEVPSVIVTGSNGKSTVVSLINALLSFEGSRPYLCGNIGHPVVELLENNVQKPSVLVVEASSYQLEISKGLKPQIGILLNVSENHLERHGTLEAYLEAKLNLVRHQTPDNFAVINFDDDRLVKKSRLLPGTLCAFGKDKKALKQFHSNAWIEYEPSSDKDFVHVTHEGHTERFDLKQSTLVGEHTRYNWAAALLTGVLYGAPFEHMNECIRSFQGLEHRLEVVLNTKERIVINDSKSTTVASTVAALTSIRKAFPERQIFLLIGGKMKQGSWAPLAETINSNRALVHVSCFGGDGSIIKENLQEFGINCLLFNSLDEATRSVVNQPSTKPDIILLSPGCASFDEFTDFEARGRAFKTIVTGRKIKGAN